MAKCEVCGNEYYLSFEVVAAGNRHTFDCFECAIHKLAPICSHCGCKVIRLLRVRDPQARADLLPLRV